MGKHPPAGTPRPARRLKGMNASGTEMGLDQEGWNGGGEGLTVAPPAIQKIRYSHADMIDFLITNPGVSQNAIAARYGYTPSWVSRVMSSDAFQSALAARREELVDPTVAASIDERFRALTTKSLERLMEKLEAPQVSDNVVLKAVELGAKAMGVGGNASPPPPAQDHLAQLATRLLALQSGVRQQVQERIIDAQAIEITPSSA